MTDSPPWKPCTTCGSPHKPGQDCLTFAQAQTRHQMQLLKESQAHVDSLRHRLARAEQAFKGGGLSLAHFDLGWFMPGSDRDPIEGPKAVAAGSKDWLNDCTITVVFPPRCRNCPHGGREK